MPSQIKSFPLKKTDLEKLFKSKAFKQLKAVDGLGDLKTVEGSKLNYILLSKYGEELYIAATVLPKRLETRFMVAGNARNDRFHLNGYRKQNNKARRFTELVKQLSAEPKTPLEVISKKTFTVNTEQAYVSTKDLQTFIAVYKATRQTELSTSEVDEYLKEVYEESNTVYHQGTAESRLTDNQFDQLKAYLVAKNLVSKERVGAAPAPATRKVELSTPLGSLENAFKADDLKKFFRNFKVATFLTTPKIDGISAQIDYIKGKFKSGNTKGDGYVGEDITALLKLVPSVPKVLTKPVTVSIRCELFIKDSVFNKKYGRESGREKPFANARNMMAGLKNRKIPDPAVAKDVSVLGYEILNKLQNKSEQLSEIKGLGFPTVPYKVIKLSEAEKAFQAFRSNEDYKQDGSVVEIDDKTHRTGFIGSGINPKFSVAFKPETERAETTVRSVKWTISKDGYFKPTIYFDPVVVEGATVRKASVHNAKKVKTLGLGPGARIIIIRAGAAIPHIDQVLEPAKPEYPKANNWVWNANGVDIILKQGEDSDSQEIEKIKTFFATLKVERFSEGLIKLFYEHGFKTIPDILHMTREQIVEEVPRQGDVSSQNIITEFAKLKKPGVSLPDLLTASGCFGRGLGILKFKDLYNVYGDKLVSGWQGSSLSDIATSIDEVPGFSFETGKQFAQGIKPFIEFYKSIKDVIYIKKQNTVQGPLTGQSIAFSGFRDKAWKEQIEALGGIYSESVSSKTTLLVSDTQSDKTRKAEKNGTQIMSRSQFKTYLNKQG